MEVWRQFATIAKSHTNELLLTLRCSVKNYEVVTRESFASNVKMFEVSRNPWQSRNPIFRKIH